MERVLSQNERIRRAEEIYARRQNLRDRTKKATVNVSERRKFKLLKRIALQITICILIYFIFYLINTTNYSFSESTLDKTEELISYDVDFISIYNNIESAINEYMYSLNNTLTNENEDTTNEEENEAVEDEDEKEYSFILPVSGYVTSEFGTRESTSSIVSTYHKGIDIGATTGTSIIAATDGTVVKSQYNSSYGNYVMIENGEVKTVYAHCSELLVSVRRHNSARARNCKSSAQPGNSTGPHLHFEIRINDICVNPRLILDF